MQNAKQNVLLFNEQQMKVVLMLSELLRRVSEQDRAAVVEAALADAKGR